jgi:hypothetical protein
MTTDMPDGKVINTSKTLTTTAGTVPGDHNISGIVTRSNGTVDQISGTKDATLYGFDSHYTLTNPGGKTETFNSETLRASDAVAHIDTGTNFKGKAVSGAQLMTTNSAPPHTNAVDTTANGLGSYTYSASQNGNVTTTDINRTFSDGVSSSITKVATANSDGSTTYNDTVNRTNAMGGTSTSSTVETYAHNGSGGQTISGSFTQANGETGTLAGTSAPTSYGNLTNLTYTNQSAATKTGQARQLSVGDAELNINTGTDFNGKPGDSAGLITGDAVP